MCIHAWKDELFIIGIKISSDNNNVVHQDCELWTCLLDKYFFQRMENVKLENQPTSETENVASQHKTDTKKIIVVKENLSLFLINYIVKKEKNFKI